MVGLARGPRGRSLALPPRGLCHRHEAKALRRPFRMGGLCAKIRAKIRKAFAKAGDRDATLKGVLRERERSLLAYIYIGLARGAVWYTDSLCRHSAALVECVACIFLREEEVRTTRLVERDSGLVVFPNIHLGNFRHILRNKGPHFLEREGRRAGAARRAWTNSARPGDALRRDRRAPRTGGALPQSDQMPSGASSQSHSSTRPSSSN